MKRCPMINEQERLRLHNDIEACQSLRDLKDLARSLVEQLIQNEIDSADSGVPICDRSDGTESTSPDKDNLRDRGKAAAGHEMDKP
ncbi:hypothetical protein MITS9504_00056 [Synechococcus sp. MIT S9504]|nr:hypothetical protein MITS9504_00056 [Synechococcus sp. MIT S9504]